MARFPGSFGAGRISAQHCDGSDRRRRGGRLVLVKPVLAERVAQRSIGHALPIARAEHGNGGLFAAQVLRRLARSFHHRLGARFLAKANQVNARPRANPAQREHFVGLGDKTGSSQRSFNRLALVGCKRGVGRQRLVGQQNDQGGVGRS